MTDTHETFDTLERYLLHASQRHPFTYMIVKCLQVELVHLYGLASSWTSNHHGLFAYCPC